MKTQCNIKESRLNDIEKLKNDTNLFIGDINKEFIETILLSGSVARGDYFPGEMGGMIDLTVMKKEESIKTAEDIFGENEKNNIPYHCVKKNGNWFQINYVPFINVERFQILYEARKYAMLESKVIYDKDGKYKEALSFINKASRHEQIQYLEQCIEYISYLLSDYKKDRWARREAYIQMHENLNTAIIQAVRCLYYINGLYCPADDRRLYYSLELEKVPQNINQIIIELWKQNMDSLENYEERESLFRNGIFEFIKKNRPTIASTG